MVASRYHLNVECRLDRMRRAAVNTIAEHGAMCTSMVLVKPEGEQYGPFMGAEAITEAAKTHDGVGFIGIVKGGKEVQVLYANQNVAVAQAAPIETPHGWPIVGPWRYIEPPVFWCTLYDNANPRCEGGK